MIKIWNIKSEPLFNEQTTAYKNLSSWFRNTCYSGIFQNLVNYESKKMAKIPWKCQSPIYRHLSCFPGFATLSKRSARDSNLFHSESSGECKLAKSGKSKRRFRKYLYSVNFHQDRNYAARCWKPNSNFDSAARPTLCFYWQLFPALDELFLQNFGEILIS